MKLCKQCIHYDARPEAVSQCRAPSNTHPDYVNGGTRFIQFSAQGARIDVTLCGPEARWFQPAPLKAVA